MGQRVAVRHLEGASALALHEQNSRWGFEAGLDDIVTRDDREHTRDSAGRAGIDGHDFGVGVIAAQERRMRLTVEIPIRGILALP